MKVFGNNGPDLRLDAISDQGGSGILGDALPDSGATLDASVLAIAPGEPEHLLKHFRDGEEVCSVVIGSPGGTHAFRAESSGCYRIQLQRDGVIVALTSALTVSEPGAAETVIAAGAALAWIPRRHARLGANQLGCEGGASLPTLRAWKNPKIIVCTR